MKRLFCGLICIMGWAAAMQQGVAGETPEKQFTLKFTEELRVGEGEDDPHFTWLGNHVAVQADDRGHLFITDPMENRVVELDRDGRFIREIGRKGQGPGEFQLLSSFTLLADGSAVVFDNSQTSHAFHYFDKDMKFVKTNRSKNSFVQSAFYAHNGRYYHGTWFKGMKDNRGDVVWTGLQNGDHQPFMKLTEDERFTPDPSLRGSAFATAMLTSWFRVAGVNRGVIAFGPDSGFFTARSDKYLVTQWSPDKKKIRTITRKYKPIPWKAGELKAYVDPVREEILGALPGTEAVITEAVIRECLESAGFSPAKPPVMGLIPMPDGGLLVIHDYQIQTGVVMADIFNKDGDFLGTARLPDIEVNLFGGFFGSPVKLNFKKDKAYAVLEGKDGEPVAVRYGYILEPK